MSIFIFFGLIFGGLLIWFLLRYIRNSQRNKLFLKPLRSDWIQILENNIPIYSNLPTKLIDELHGRINIFLDEKEFFGCKDLEITDEIRVTIAGSACILLLKRDKHCFPGFTTILVYPDTYVSQEVRYNGNIEINHESVRAGESWYRGPVVLSWNDVLHGTKKNSDGFNVVLHEFAHKLDEENEIMDGLPVLRQREHYAEWAEVLSKEYESFQMRVNNGTNTVIDEYGAVSPVEFFAVATESFFEKSEHMKKNIPDLYQQLKRFYGLDPAEWRKR